MSATVTCPRCEGEGWIPPAESALVRISPNRVCPYCEGRKTFPRLSSHPVEPERESTSDVFIALLRAVHGAGAYDAWVDRWNEAMGVDRRRRDYDRARDDSLLTVSRAGQGGG